MQTNIIGGMAGPGVLGECLIDPSVEGVLTMGRSVTGMENDKLWEFADGDLLNFSAKEGTEGVVKPPLLGGLQIVAKRLTGALAVYSLILS